MTNVMSCQDELTLERLDGSALDPLSSRYEINRVTLIWLSRFPIMADMA